MSRREPPRRASAGQVDLPDEATPEQAVPLLDPARLAARLALRRALAAQQVDAARLRGAVIIEVPEAGWVEPVGSAWPEVVDVPGRSTSGGRPGDLAVRPGEWMIFEGEGGPARRSRHPPGYEDEQVALCLWQGQDVLGIAPAPDRQLPPDLRRVADLRLVLAPLDPATLREVAAAVTGSQPRTVLPPELCARLTPALLRLARRPGQTADDFVARAARLAAPAPRAAAAAALDNLPGLDEAVAWGRDLARDLRDYAEGRLAWREIDRGCLLAGPPGTGKTSFAQALAATCGVPLVAASYAGWQSSRGSHLGDLLRAMAATFDQARQAAPCILFIDELEALHTRQTSGQHGDWWTAVIGGLLEQLDGVGGREGVVVVGASNHPEMIDPAILRAGRLDRLITIPLPDRQALAAILRVHLGEDLAGADLARAALHAQGGTGADCAKWVRGARRRARHGRRPVVLDDLLAEIRGAVTMRPEQERRVAAVHEAGHALVQVLEQPGSLRHVSIREDAHSGGHTLSEAPGGDVSEAWLATQLRRLLAGRAAEAVVLGQVTGGSGGPANSDLARATRLALNAETALGLAARPLLWRGWWEGRDVATLLMSRPDLAGRVEARLNAANEEVSRLLRQHRAILDLLVAALLEREVLDGNEVEAIVQARKSSIADAYQ
ncbi:AAA family ATPase [Teichococcus vastitatis]|uniref:AAA family ATPase n=1 Tax=Teichococcus vastitatis TaxID=2307076 RepID=UPI000E70E756|nr:AAA family ATPase [Pseudoroseomonas vastitatis]